MTDRDKWLAVGLFVIGVAGVSGGILLEGLGTIPLPFGIAVSVAGFVAFAFATAAYIRWETGKVSRRRVLVIVGTFLAVGVITLGSIYAPERLRLGTVIVGLVTFGAMVYWNTKIVADKDVVVRDERVDLLRYKASHRAWQLLIFLLAIWYWLEQFASDQLPVGVMIVGLLLVGMFAYSGFYRYYTRHQ